MKKIFSLLVLAASMLCITSCSEEEDPIWDIAPTNVNIRLVDADGNNLLDPNVEGNWIGEDMHISTSDDSYSAIWNVEELFPRSRACLAVFSGLLWSGLFNDDNDSNNVLRFGDFDGDSNHNMHLTFNIACINTIYEFDFIHECNWKKKSPKIKNHIVYNGKKIEGNTIELVVPRNPNK